MPSRDRVAALKRDSGYVTLRPPAVWFNQHLSNSWQIWRQMAKQRRCGEFRLVCSQHRRQEQILHVIDAFEREPQWLADDDYVNFCLDFVERNAIDIFYPGRKAIAIAQAHELFARKGVQLITVADPSTMRQLQSKVFQCQQLRDTDVAIPPYAVIERPEQFAVAYKNLRTSSATVCCKPSESIFGFGFRVIVEGDLPPAHAPWLIPLDAVQDFLINQQQRFPILLMAYLPGPERSVDCLAHRGELVRCIIRRKLADDSSKQWIERHELIEHFARTITQHFCLNAVFNIQFRDWEDKPYLLEINTRMSGGIVYTLSTGFCLPYWAVRFALGTADPKTIPYGPVNMKVTTDLNEGVMSI